MADSGNAGNQENEYERAQRENPFTFGLALFLLKLRTAVQNRLSPVVTTPEEQVEAQRIMAAGGLTAKNMPDVNALAAKRGLKRKAEDDAPGKNEAERKDAADQDHQMGVAQGAQADADAPMREIIKVKRKNPQAAALGKGFKSHIVSIAIQEEGETTTVWENLTHKKTENSKQGPGNKPNEPNEPNAKKPKTRK